MNYYEKHIGDYIRDTVSLTMLEDGAYNRLIDQVYQSERPLPLDKKEVYRMARAGTTPERKAVDYVLGKFFQLTDSGYMQKRAQAVIEEFWDREPAKETKRENAKIRQQRSRDRRKALFDQLRELGVTPEFNASMRYLETELSRVTKRDESQNSNDTVTRDDTLTQTPDTNTQLTPLPPTPVESREDLVAPTAKLSMAMRPYGIKANPGDLQLKALAAAGITPAEVSSACETAKESKPHQAITANYVIGILKRGLQDAAQVRANAKPTATKRDWE